MFSFLKAYIYLDISKFYFCENSFYNTDAILSNKLVNLYNKHVHTDNKLDY